ncbi:hypothetical protein ACE3MS_15355 [Paenibacillus dendritiformis]|uniref:hypothetical protein n=1 Tax=Paenibacillus dendritiformis TaxID=130049 RepID=UPI0036696A05
MEYYILSLKWSKGKGEYVWWGPDDSGYVKDINQAGKYSEERINSKPLYYRNTNTFPVPCEIVEQLFLQRVVPTTTENWAAMNIDYASLKEY